MTEQIREVSGGRAVRTFEPRVNPMPGQVLMDVRFGEDYEDDGARAIVQDIVDAKLVTSLVEDAAARLTLAPYLHKPVIDIDLPAKVIPSSTEGHGHLFIDKEMSWDDYLILLRALVAVGIVEPGYLKASERRGHTAVRLPWVKKEEVAEP